VGAARWAPALQRRSAERGSLRQKNAATDVDLVVMRIAMLSRAIHAMVPQSPGLAVTARSRRARQILSVMSLSPFHATLGPSVYSDRCFLAAFRTVTAFASDWTRDAPLAVGS
jgi:hypothetical protein